VYTPTLLRHLQAMASPGSDEILPSADEHSNRVWLTAALLALNLAAICCDLCHTVRAGRWLILRPRAIPGL
jgi:hypothetical protein